MDKGCERNWPRLKKGSRNLRIWDAENAASIEELNAASLKEGEEDELIQEREVLKKAVQIREKAFEAHQTLYSKSGSLMEGFTEVKRALEFLASTNPKLVGLRENFEDAVYRLEDVALELRGVAETSHSDPARLEQIEERLALIRRLKRKYRARLGGADWPPWHAVG